jgi:membrane associated rhomboid family serine protease
MPRRTQWRWFLIGAIGLLYLFYAVIYFYGLDGADDYFWVNNDFFLVEIVGASAIITGVLSAAAIRERQDQPDDAKTWRPFRPALAAAGLTILFVPYAIALAFISFLTGFQDF